jgi:16S rRNA processing protein RimM
LTQPTQPARRFVPVAEIARPHGVRGEIRLQVYNLGSDLLLARPPVQLRFPDGATRDVKIRSARPVNKGILVEIEGVTDRDAAEALRGAEVCVRRDLFPAEEEGEFYACDLEGAKAVLPSGEEVGRVTAVQSYPSCDVLVIDRGKAGPLEVPLVDAYVASVDPERGVVELVTIEGLT